MYNTFILYKCKTSVVLNFLTNIDLQKYFTNQYFLCVYN